MKSAFGTVMAALGLLVGMMAVGLVLHASGATGRPPSSVLVVVGMAALVVGVITFGYGTGADGGY